MGLGMLGVAVTAVSISVDTGDASPVDHNICDSAEIVSGVRVCVTGDRGREGHWEHGGW